MKHLGALSWLALAVASMALVQAPRSQLSELAARAGLDRPVAAWCGGELQPGRPGAFAVAATYATGGGRYLVLASDATVVELASFTGGADLSCYSRVEAEQLGATIRGSLTIEGQVTPRWNTVVVCGLVDNTTSVCWQYSPDDGMFVQVGGWVT